VGKLRDLLGLVMSLRLVTDPDSGVLLEYTPAGTRVSLDEAQELAVRITGSRDRPTPGTRSRPISAGDGPT
jgi:hypothetical protein